MNLVGGCDPGLSGALALIDADTHDVIECIDMPVQAVGNGRRQVDCTSLQAALAKWHDAGCRLVVYEGQSAFAGGGRQIGASSAKSIGWNEGALHASLIASRLVFEIAHPAVWKRAMGLTRDKADSRVLARQLFPMAPPLLGRRKDEGRAEALLLAAYAARRWRAAA